MVNQNNLVFQKMRKQKTCFAGFPTPLQFMPNLTEALGGPNLYVKRDDMTDLAFGGNKARKLEFLFADAKNKGADTMISTGAVQSNCACMVASASRRLGMKPVLVLVGPEPKVYDGNLLLDKLLGAEIHFLDTYGPHLEEYMNKLAKEYSANGYTPYVVSAGASVPLTVPGYVLAVEEVVNQFKAHNKTVDYLVCTCGTGGTQAGLVLGTKLLGVDTKVVSASVFASKEDASKNIVEMANECAQLYCADVCVGVDDVVVFDDYIKEGYSVINNDVKEAIKLMAQTEGIFLDPIYTGKAMVMLIDQIKKGYFKKDSNIVFFHTGGLAALCLYRDELSKP